MQFTFDSKKGNYFYSANGGKYVMLCKLIKNSTYMAPALLFGDNRQACMSIKLFLRFEIPS